MKLHYIDYYISAKPVTVCRLFLDHENCTHISEDVTCKKCLKAMKDRK